VADDTKLESYFVYLAKGIDGKEGSPVRVLYSAEPRMWALMHDQFHRVAAERAAARRARPPSDFYTELADKCKAERKTTKEDVLSVVVRYYVEDGKKGFSTFQVNATFGRVFSLVNGTEAMAFFYEQASANLFRW